MQQRIPYRALAEFRYEIRRYLNFSERAARAVGIEPQQHQALLSVKGLPDGAEATVGSLAEQLQIQHNSAVELAIRLESKGLVKRLRNSADRRQVLVILTGRGEKLLRGLSAMHHAELRTAGPKLLRALEVAVWHARNSRGGHPTRTPRASARVRGKKSQKRG